MFLFWLDVFWSRPSDGRVHGHPSGTHLYKVHSNPATHLEGSIVMQFELHGCYVDRRITCSGKNKPFKKPRVLGKLLTAAKS